MNAMVRNLVARLRLQPQDEGGPSRMEMLRQRSEAADTLEAMSRTAVNRNRVIRRLRRRCERRLKLANRGAPYKVIEFLLHMQKHEFVCPLCKGSGKLKTYIDRPKTRIRCEMSKPLSETGAGETSPAAACSADRGHCYARTRAQDCVGDLERALSDQWVLENQPILWLNFGNGLLQDLFCKRAGVVGMDVHANHLVTDSERMVAATVVQWLGTNCGREFLEKAFARAGWAGPGCRWKVERLAMTNQPQRAAVMVENSKHEVRDE